VIPPRLRFAPAPTGFLHLGSARTALFNWLQARHSGGQMILRIEDTNAELATQEYVDNIFDTLEWLGLDWDGPAVRQSQRGELYRDAVERLLAGGHAYDDEGAVRFRVPADGATSWDDVIRGQVTFEHTNVEDFVIARSDGTPTFFLANAVDDLDLGITLVVRGEDLLNVTPKVLLLREALGGGPPLTFAHLPLIVDEQRRKLSKRRDAVATEDYRAQGYLPEALTNYLALLGWGPPDGVEIRPRAEIVELFDVRDIHKAPAAFDQRKLLHINGEYLRSMPTGEFLDRARPFLDGANDETTLAAIAPLVQERVKTLAEVWPHVDFLFLVEPDVDEQSWAKAMANPAAAAVLDDAIAAYTACTWEATTLHDTLAEVGDRHGLKLATAQAPVRVAVTGRTVGPPLFESLYLLGREPTLRRMRAARARLR
jgi:glutamyl-tRNA synthetase